MSLFESALFGIIQGFTEFLPISSTAHLTLFGKLFGTISAEHPEQWTAYIAVIQLGTLLAVIVYFWKDLLSIIGNFFKDNIFKPRKFSEQSQDSKLGWYVIVGTMPVIIVGLLLKKVIEGSLTKSLLIIAISLVVWGLLLGLAEKIAQHKRDMGKLSMKDAILVGLAQCFALIPGSSRSGTTMTFGLFAGLTRETAARFSFLLSLPAVLASALLELQDSLSFLTRDMLVSYLIGIVFAFLVGYWSIGFLLKFLKTRTTWVFVWYRVLLGAVLLGLIQFTVLK